MSAVQDQQQQQQQHSRDDHFSSSSDSEVDSTTSPVVVAAPHLAIDTSADDDHPMAAATGQGRARGADDDVPTEFWMATRQTQCGANLTERMVSFMKQVTAAQAEFADKLAAISAAELQRAKNGPADSPIYAEYWTQLQLAMRLCRTWSASTKEMTSAIGALMAPMDRVVLIGRARMKECAHWNVELNKALSVFHTNVAKRQAKCYKALAVVMTPEYFDQTPAHKAHAVRRAAPTVAKYVEQIDEANAWLTKYMAQRPTLKTRLETLEAKRIDLTRTALTTFAAQIQTMGQVLAETAQEIVAGVDAVDDRACKMAFVNDLKALPTPHLENPALFEYTLPQQQQQQQQQASDADDDGHADDDEADEDVVDNGVGVERAAAAQNGPTRFGNIPINNGKAGGRPGMKVARRASAVANADEMDRSFMAPSA
ncbi:hypothetical protein PBRA_007934 [Plasmodiophora brassicae]|uniref:Uncharacterized protein n=1 Tax=Plasmodiophora brassicae TaxID=37360 RepID=A0A0G4IY13_PLABS|nr:hypothetical protein PBRA_007934 [Plasmodiophora brassicae]